MNPVNTIPSAVDITSKTINIRSNIHSTTNNITYYNKFNIIGEDCRNPMISIYFEDTDFDGCGGDVEFVDVYYMDHFIISCGSNDGVCNDYKYCLANYSLGDELILDGQQVVIAMIKGKDSGVPSGCDYSLWADVTLTCGNDPQNSGSVSSGLYTLT